MPNETNKASKHQLMTRIKKQMHN